jgi:hypothetical protein
MGGFKRFIKSGMTENFGLSRYYNDADKMLP